MQTSWRCTTSPWCEDGGSKTAFCGMPPHAYPLLPRRQGGVCLEERLQLDRAHDGIIISPAVHYMEGQLVGSRLVDQLMVGTGYRCAWALADASWQRHGTHNKLTHKHCCLSGWRPSVVSKAFAHTAINITQDILSVMQPRGPGGFDFLSGE